MLVSNSDIQKRLAAHQKNYQKAIAAYQTDTGSYDEQAPQSNLDKAKGILGKAGSVAKGIGQEISKPYNELGAGLAEVVADVSGQTKRTQKALNDDIQNATVGIKAAGAKLNDPTVPPEEKARWQKVLELNQQRVNDAYAASSSRTKEVTQRTDPKKGAGNVAKIGLDVLSAGTYGTAAKGAQTGKLIRDAKIGAGLTGRAALEGAGSGAALGATGDLVSQGTDNEDFSLKRLATDTTLGGVMGALGGAQVGRAGEKAAQAAEQKAAAHTKALFGSVDEKMGKAADEINAEANIIPESRRLGTGEEHLQSKLDEIDQKLAPFRGGDTNIATPNGRSYTKELATEAGTADKKATVTQLQSEVKDLESKVATHPTEESFSKERVNLSKEYDKAVKAVQAKGLPEHFQGKQLNDVDDKFEKLFNEIDDRAQQAVVDKPKVQGLLEDKKRQLDNAQTAPTDSATFTKSGGGTTGELTADDLRDLLRQRQAIVHEMDKARTPAQGEDLATSMQALSDHPSAPQIADVPPVPPRPGEAPTTSAAAVENPVLTGELLQPKTFEIPPAVKQLDKSPNFLKRVFTSESGKLSQAGTGGRKIVAGLDNMRNNSEVAQAAFVKQIPSVLKLSKKEFSQFVDGLEALSKGESPNLTGNINRAIGEWTRVIPTIRQAAVDAGLEVGDLGDTYFPRNYTKLLESKNGYQQAIKHLVSTGQAENTIEAANLLQHMKTRYATPFGHFDNSRKLDLPDYDKTKDALVSYVSGAFNKISHAEQFGANGEKAAEFLDTVAKEKGERAQIQALKSYMVSTGQYKWDRADSYLKTTGAIRSFNRMRSLGLSALLNAGQTTNTATLAGVWRTARAATKLLSSDEREYIKDTGVVIDSVLSNLREAQGVAGKVTSKLTAPGFNSVERFNRSVAAEAGKMWATKLAKKASSGDTKAEQVLREKLGVTGDIGKELTKEQQIQASRKLVETAQFKVDPQDLPGWASSPEGKMVAQFRTFAYKQTGFMYNQVLKEAARGDVIPLTRFLAVGIPIGYLAGKTRAELKGGDQQDKSLTGDLLGAVQNVGAFGMLSDVGFLGSNIKSQRFPQYLASSLAGPTAGLAVQTASNVQQAAAGNAAPLGRQALQVAPSPVGSRLSNAILPYKSNLSDKQNEFVSKVSQKEQPVYEDFFTDMSKTGGKTKIAKQIKTDVSQGNFARAKRLADQHNQQVDAKIEKLQQQTGGLDPDTLDYIQSNYKVNYSYYTKHRKK